MIIPNYSNFFLFPFLGNYILFAPIANDSPPLEVPLALWRGGLLGREWGQCLLPHNFLHILLTPS